MEGTNGKTGVSDPFDSKCPGAMLIIRIIALTHLFPFIVYSLVSYGMDYFLYLTYWSLTLTTIMFILILIPNRGSTLSEILQASLSALWLVNLLITILYWSLLSGDLSDDDFLKLLNSISIHVFPILFNSIEIFSNKAVVKRIYILYALAFFFGYFFLFNMPYTLAVGELYDNLTYKNWFTYICLACSVVAFLIFGEILYRIKGKILESQTEKSEGISLPLLNP